MATRITMMNYDITNRALKKILNNEPLSPEQRKAILKTLKVVRKLVVDPTLESALKRAIRKDLESKGNTK